MDPTAEPTLTLITCHPYLVDTHRMVVFARLVEPEEPRSQEERK